MTWCTSVMTKSRSACMTCDHERELNRQFTFDNSGSEHHAWLMAMPYFARQDKLTGGVI